MNLKIRAHDASSPTVIEPIPGYVLKSSTASGKLFVNVCQSDLIDPASSVDMESVRVPMSISAVFQDYDNAGRSCYVIDVVVSEQVFRESLSLSMSGSDFHRFIRESIERKHGIHLLCDFKIIKKSYMGERVRPQCIRMSSSSLIKEVEPVEIARPPCLNVPIPSLSLSYRSDSKDLEIDVLKLPQLTSTAEHLQRGLIQAFAGEKRHVGAGMSLEEALRETTELVLILRQVMNPFLYRLKVSNQRVHVSKSGMDRREFHIWFPRVMDPNTAVAQFNASEKSILLTMKVHEA